MTIFFVGHSMHHYAGTVTWADRWPRRRRSSNVQGRVAGNGAPERFQPPWWLLWHQLLPGLNPPWPQVLYKHCMLMSDNWRSGSIKFRYKHSFFLDEDAGERARQALHHLVEAELEALGGNNNEPVENGEQELEEASSSILQSMRKRICRDRERHVQVKIGIFRIWERKYISEILSLRLAMLQFSQPLKPTWSCLLRNSNAWGLF